MQFAHSARSVCLMALALTVSLALAGCGNSTQDTKDTAKQVTVVTHDSWAMAPAVEKKFESETGLKLKILKQGDVGTLVNKLVLTKQAPLADAVYGIDNTFASRAVDEGVMAPYEPALKPGQDAFRLGTDADKSLTPVDYSDVCVNVDDSWFEAKGLTPPASLDDLTKPAYKGLFVAPGATTSSPGLAFLLTTIAAKGQHWQDYWKALIRNDIEITSGWSEAYEGDFTAGGGAGKRPIVVSYSSSPPFTIPKGADKPTTSALLDTCFRQVEYAGVLNKAANPEGARKFVDFMISEQVQAGLPDTMYVYPTDSSVKLPEGWARFAPASSRPWTVPVAEITANRSAWLRDWRDLTSQ